MFVFLHDLTDLRLHISMQPRAPANWETVAAHWPHLQATVLRHESFQIVASKAYFLHLNKRSNCIDLRNVHSKEHTLGHRGL